MILPRTLLLDLRLASRLGRRFGRSPALARSSIVVGVAAAFLVTMMMVLSALTLSGVQIVDRDLGRFGAYAGFGAFPVAEPGDDRVVAALTRATQKASGRDVMVTLITDALPVASRAGRHLTMWEGDWRSEPFPRRMRLLSGRWPTEAGDVVVTDPPSGDADIPARPGMDLPVSGRPAGLRVVGIADDRYATQTAVLAAPGTWATLDRGLSTTFRGLTAQATVYWAGNAPDAVLAALEPLATDAEANGITLTQTYADRSIVSRMRGKVWLQKSPAGYLVPSLLLPVSSLLLVAGINHRRHRRAMLLVTDTGISRRVAAASLTLPLVFWSMIAAIGGLAIGGVLGTALRPLVAAANDRPPGEIGNLGGTALRVLGLLVVSGIGVGVRLSAADVKPRRAPRTARRLGRVRDARQLLSVAAWCAVLLTGAWADSTAKSMIFAGVLAAAVLLVVPEVVAGVVRRLPERGPRQRLSRRQMAADQHRIAAVTGLLALCLGASAAFLVLLATFTSSAEAGRYPDVLPGQLRVGDSANQQAGPPRAVLDAVQRSGAVRQATRVDLRTLIELRDADLLARVSAQAAPSEGLLFAVTNVGQVEALLGQSLEPGARAALVGGGIVLWGDPGRSRPASTRLLVHDDHANVVTRTVDVRAAWITIRPSALLAGSDGLTLTATASRLGLPATAEGPVLFTGLSDQQVDAAREAVLAANLDLRTLSSYERPATVLAPVALYATAAGLAGVGLLVSVVATHGQTRTMRDYLARLVSVGLSPAWARSVVLRQHAVMVAVATSLSVLMAVPPALLNSLNIDGAVLSVPWHQLVVLWAATFVGTLIAALLAARQIRAVDRT